MFAQPLISPDDSISLWTFLVGWAAISIILERKYRWAATLSGTMIALLGAMLLANIGVIPTEAPCYDDVWGYIVPMAIPLLLFDADIRRIMRESGRTFFAFHIASLGTVIGTAIATLLFYSVIPEIKGVLAMLCATYIGGSINLVAMKDAFNVSTDMTSAVIVADNFLMALYFFVLMTVPKIPLFLKHFNAPHEMKVRARQAEVLRVGGADESDEKQAADSASVPMHDIVLSLAISLFIVMLATKLSAFINSSQLPGTLKLFIGQRYLLLTAITVAIATMMPRSLGVIRGAREMGVFFIHIFFVVIGVPASISMIMHKSPTLFIFAAVIVLTNFVVTMVLGKIFKLDLEELLVSCNATIGGPTTAAAMVTAKGWNDMVIPAILVGVWGYIIGNFLGILMAGYFGKMLNLT